jgi:MerR family redox-sensitive transcriptional activator SoxR
MAFVPRKEGLSIGEVARDAGIRPSAIRYYESVGLLPEPRRKSGHRRYDASTVRLIGTLRFAQRAGFTVAEIRTLFHGFGAEVPPARRWQALAERKLQELDELIASAQRMRRAVEAGMRCGCLRIEDCATDLDAGCCLPAPALTPLGRR